MREIYIIYNKKTGYIEDGGGRIDRTKPGKMMNIAIPRILSEGPDREVLYLPNQSLPNSEKHKIKDGKIVKLTQEDKAAIEVARPRTEIELLEDRVSSLEALIFP